jgi:cytoskeleton protein RodZ
MSVLESAEQMDPPQMDQLNDVLELDVGPGQRLQQGREAVNLSIEEVSARLHLDIRTVRCLEADQYDQLPAPTFVRGYLRSYARLLNVPAQPVVDAFDRRGLEPPALIPDISTSDEARSTDTSMRAATITIVAVLFALVLVAWQSQIGTEWIWGAPGEQNITQTPAALEPSLPRLADAQAPTEAESLALGTTPATSTPVNTDSGALTGSVTDSSLVSLPQAANRAPDPPAPSATGNPTPAVVLAAAGANPPGVAHLVVRVRVSSWVEIYDRNGERLYYATGQAGDVVDVRGAEPLQVLVGFAEGVNVEYNGRPFALAPHIARGVARFTLGQQ